VLSDELDLGPFGYERGTGLRLGLVGGERIEGVLADFSRNVDGQPHTLELLSYNFGGDHAGGHRLRVPGPAIVWAERLRGYEAGRQRMALAEFADLPEEPAGG
jgi:hypothetical protein